MDDEVRENVEPETPQPAEPAVASGDRKKADWAIFAFVVLIVVLGYLFLPGYYYSWQAAKIERKCARKLRWLGACEVSYQGTNIWKVYGTLENLQEGNLVDKDYTSDTVIANYELECTVWLNAAYSEENYKKYGMQGDGWYNTFTIVAYPRNYPKPLRTFAISEDQNVRVYNPANGNQFNGRDDPMVQSWDIYFKWPDLEYPESTEYWQKIMAYPPKD